MYSEKLTNLDQERLKLDVYPPSLFVRPEYFAKLVDESGSYEKLYQKLKDKFEIEKETELFKDLHNVFTRWFTDYLGDFNYFGMSPDECVKKYADKYFEFFYLDQMALMTSLRYPGFAQSVEVVDNIGYKRILQKSPVVFAVSHVGPHYFLPAYFNAMGLPTIFSGGFGSHIQKGYQNYCDNFNLKQEMTYVKFDDDYFKNCKAKLKTGSNLLIYPEYSRSERVGTLTTDFYEGKIHVPCGAIRLGNQFNLPVVLVHIKKAGDKYQVVYDSVHYPIKFKLLKGSKGTYREIQKRSLEIFESVKKEIYAQPEYWEGWRYYNIIRENTKKALESKQQD